MGPSTITVHTPKSVDNFFRYELAELDEEVVVCKRCGKMMHYRSSRIREIMNAKGDICCITDAPRFACKCGSTRMMHPYFLSPRKKYSLVAIQEIVSADAYGNKKGVVAYVGSGNVYYSRRWVVKYLWGLLEEKQIGWPMTLPKLEAIPNDREGMRGFICGFHETYGDDWLLEIVLVLCKANVVDLSPLRSLI